MLHFVRLSWKPALMLGLSLMLVAGCAMPPLLVAPQEAAMQEMATQQEMVVDVGNGIVGTLTRPAGEGPFPAVLMVHGFASTRDEVGNMYAREAEALADQGIASLRIDFRGGGDSAGDFADTTIDGQAADAETALLYLLDQDFVDAQRVGLLGFSLGGAIAMITAGAHPDKIDSLVVWSTVGDLREDFLASLGQEMFDEAAAQGSAFQDLGWRTITLKQDFFESLDDYDLPAELAEYDGSFMAFAGGDDPLSMYAEPMAELAGGDAMILPEADHIYYVLTEDQTKANTVIASTAARFADTLGS